MAMKNIMFKTRIATKNLEDEINIINAIEMLEATTELFEKKKSENKRTI